MKPFPLELVAMRYPAKSAFAFLAGFLTLILPPLLSAQNPSGSVSGAIICDDGNAPARGAKVTLIPLNQLLSRTEEGSKSTSTDFSGVYELRSVPAGTYVLNATMDGYDDDVKLVLSALDTFNLEDRKKLIAALPQITVKPGASVREDLVLRRAGAISGHAIVDLGGVPGRVSVTATRITTVGMPVSLIDRSQKPEPFTQSALTDDRGVFRIAGLPAGKYRISLRIAEAFFSAQIGKHGEVHVQPERPGTAELEVYAPESFNEASARTFDLHDGDEITDADITVPMRLLHSVAGVVTRGGAPVAGFPITLERKGESMLEYSAVSMPDGSYRFDLIPKGNYIVRAKDASSSSVGETSIQITDSDILDANIDIRGSVGLVGR